MTSRAESPALDTRGALDGRTAAGRERIAQAAARALASPALVGAIIGVGVVLRLVRYLHDRSLWLDESLLALNLMSRSYGHLFGTLSFDQGAPVAFLFLEKLAISAFGDGERAFRLFPFLAGLGSLALFWPVARRFVGRRAGLIALALFAVMQPFIYYSTETKQYSFDVFVTLALLLLFDRALTLGSVGSVAALAVAGVAAPWLSHPSIFVLAGVGAALVLASWRAHDLRATVIAAAAPILWLASFAAEYLASIRHLHHLAASVQGVSDGGTSLLRSAYDIFSQPGAMPRTLVGLLFIFTATGAALLAFRSWPRFLALGVTLLVAAAAGAAGKYPLAGRWALFLLPSALLCVGLGARALVDATRFPLRIAPAAAVAVIVAAPAVAALEHAVHLPAAEPGTPALLEPTRQLLAALAGRWTTSDTLYVSVKSQYAFRYYLTCRDCNPDQRRERRLWPFGTTTGVALTSPSIIPDRSSLVLGRPGDGERGYLLDFARLAGRKRVWFLFTHTAPVPESTLEAWLDVGGRRREAIRAGGADLLLYDLPRAGRSVFLDAAAALPPH